MYCSFTTCKYKQYCCCYITWFIFAETDPSVVYAAVRRSADVRSNSRRGTDALYQHWLICSVIYCLCWALQQLLHHCWTLSIWKYCSWHRSRESKAGLMGQADKVILSIILINLLSHLISATLNWLHFKTFFSAKHQKIILLFCDNFPLQILPLGLWAEEKEAAKEIDYVIYIKQTTRSGWKFITEQAENRFGEKETLTSFSGETVTSTCPQEYNQ